ncbi:MAG: hypothetical protein O7B27_04940 [Gammaproteobacteria bacterium]|nr:hypothetical protein [Gammaproteobacteria bacterium]
MAPIQQGLLSRGYTPEPLMIDQELSDHSEHGVSAIQELARDALTQ